MRKVLAIGISALLAGLGSQAANSMLKTEKEDVSHQYTHLIETYQSQIFEPVSQAALFLGQPALQNSYQTAAVYFLPKVKDISFDDFPEFEDKTPKKCKDAGYNLTSCSSGSPAIICPYNSSYFKECCTSDYKYTDCAYPLTLSSDMCGGKYRCVCDTTLYPITACSVPKIPASGSENTCTSEGVTRYSKCVCPSGYTETCTGKNMQGKGRSCSENGETKYTGCECKSGYNLTCSGEGNSPANPTDYCLLNGIKYYNNCNTCAFRCTVAEADKQSSVVYEYEACSGKYCAIGCATGYVDWCVKPSTDCGKLGYQKTPSQCPNGYLKCPYGGNAVFCED